MHSNPFGEPYRNVGDAQSLALAFGNFSGCAYGSGGWSGMETCLRGLDTATLLQAQIDSETDILADLDHLLQVREHEAAPARHKAMS